MIKWYSRLFQGVSDFRKKVSNFLFPDRFTVVSRFVSSVIAIPIGIGVIGAGCFLSVPSGLLAIVGLSWVNVGVSSFASSLADKARSRWQAATADHLRTQAQTGAASPVFSEHTSRSATPVAQSAAEAEILVPSSSGN